MKKEFKILICFTLALFLMQSKVYGDPIGKIIVEGTQRIEPETVKLYLTINEGEEITSDKINESLKKLYGTGLFDDVKIDFRDKDLLVKVVESPVISRIYFDGNKRLKEEELSTEILLQPRSVYNRAKVQTDVSRIIDLYRRSGYFGVIVDPKIIERKDNRIDIVYEINEGGKTYIKKINFIGNKAFKASELHDVVTSREDAWFRIFTNPCIYDSERITYDGELIRRYYSKNGYANAKVVSTMAELLDNKEGFVVNYTIEEGLRYKIGEVAVISNLKGVEVKELEEQLKTITDDWYNGDKIESDILTLTDAVGNKGYAFVDVSPKIDKNDESKTIKITFEIGEGPKVYVDKIKIKGNVRTEDKVIRREIAFSEGDAFNADKVKKAKKSIQDLDYFETVDLSTTPSLEAGDRLNVDIEVKEKSTGSVTLGAGFSTENGPLVQAGISESNFRGSGQKVALSGTFAEKDTRFNFSFTEPYFLDRKLIGGVDAFYTTQDLQDESSYDYDSLGGALRTGWNWTPSLSQSFKYTLKQDKIYNVDNDASRYVKSEEGEWIVSMLSQGINYDKRDSRISPTEGYYLWLGNDIAGAGGDKRYLKTNAGGTHYYSILEDYILKSSLGAGYIFGINDEIMLNDRYYLGGDKLRGFKTGGVSARDKATSDAFGADLIAYNSFELSFPVGTSDDLGLRGFVFHDAGYANKPADLSNLDEFYYSSSIRASAGIGLQWRSPAGPIVVNYAFPYLKEGYDRTQRFTFNFGTNF